MRCIALKRVAIPDSVTRIGSSAFGGTSLTNVTIGSSVAYIGSGAFSFCGELTGLYCRGHAPEADGHLFFSSPRSTVFFLPGTTGWGRTFGSRPTAAWRLRHPVILPSAPHRGMTSNGFGFTISWATNATVVVDNSQTRLSNLVSD